jgi:hypothetical protein
MEGYNGNGRGEVIYQSMNIIEVELLSDDLEKTFECYHQLLRFNVRKINSAEITFEAGSSVITFKKSLNEKPLYHFAFNIPCNKIDEALKWAESKVEVINTNDQSKIADFVNWNAKAFYFYDNNGNILEFIARYDLKYETEEPFTTTSIMCLSEVGIVSDECTKTCEELRSEFNLPFFRNASHPASGFAALGDDNGLFIVVQTNRKWYLTDISATKHWQRIIVEVNGSESELINYN